MIILDKLLMGGLSFVFDKIASAVDAERDDTGAIKEELLAAQMQLELGEIDDEEFMEIERDLMARLRDARREDRPEGAVSLDRGGFEVDVSFGGDEPDDRDR
jgi:23S rRNA maturation-related 3'-5' exoribonuclease YhaM